MQLVYIALAPCLQCVDDQTGKVRTAASAEPRTAAAAGPGVADSLDLCNSWTGSKEEGPVSAAPLSRYVVQSTRPSRRRAGQLSSYLLAALYINALIPVVRQFAWQLRSPNLTICPERQLELSAGGRMEIMVSQEVRLGEVPWSVPYQILMKLS